MAAKDYRLESEAEIQSPPGPDGQPNQSQRKAKSVLTAAVDNGDKAERQL